MRHPDTHSPNIAFVPPALVNEKFDAVVFAVVVLGVKTKSSNVYMVVAWTVLAKAEPTSRMAVNKPDTVIRIRETCRIVLTPKGNLCTKSRTSIRCRGVEREKWRDRVRVGSGWVREPRLVSPAMSIPRCTR